MSVKITPVTSQLVVEIGGFTITVMSVPEVIDRVVRNPALQQDVEMMALDYVTRLWGLR